jgi:hypothetical protein
LRKDDEMSEDEFAELFDIELVRLWNTDKERNSIENKGERR